MNFRGFKNNTKVVRQFLRDSYSDQNLVDLVAHCQSGKFNFFSCCCVVGLPTANHALKERNFPMEDGEHYDIAKAALPNAFDAESATGHLIGWYRTHVTHSVQLEGGKMAILRRKLSAMARAEMKRRDVARAERRAQMTEVKCTVS